MKKHFWCTSVRDLFEGHISQRMVRLNWIWLKERDIIKEIIKFMTSQLWGECSTAVLQLVPNLIITFVFFRYSNTKWPLAPRRGPLSGQSWHTLSPFAAFPKLTPVPRRSKSRDLLSRRLVWHHSSLTAWHVLRKIRALAQQSIFCPLTTSSWSYFFTY